MTDTPPPVGPVDTPLPQPPDRLEQFKGLVGDLARPFAIISTSGAASIATVVIAHKVDGFDGAAIFIGAVFAGVGALYGAKAWEVARAGKHTAEVEIAKATSATPAP